MEVHCRTGVSSGGASSAMKTSVNPRLSLCTFVRLQGSFQQQHARKIIPCWSKNTVYQPYMSRRAESPASGTKSARVELFLCAAVCKVTRALIPEQTRDDELINRLYSLSAFLLLCAMKYIRAANRVRCFWHLLRPLVLLNNNYLLFIKYYLFN